MQLRRGVSGPPLSAVSVPHARVLTCAVPPSPLALQLRVSRHPMSPSPLPYDSRAIRVLIRLRQVQGGRVQVLITPRAHTLIADLLY